MIATLPDPEIHKHVEPQGSPFRFVWEILFKNRKKLKLTQEDRDELEAADAQADVDGPPSAGGLRGLSSGVHAA